MTRNKENSKNVKSCSEENVDSAFNEEDRKQLHEINDLTKTLVQKVKTLKEDLKTSNLKVKNLEIENVRLKRETNLTLFKVTKISNFSMTTKICFFGSAFSTKKCLFLIFPPLAKKLRRPWFRQVSFDQLSGHV